MLPKLKQIQISHCFPILNDCVDLIIINHRYLIKYIKAPIIQVTKD